MTVHVRHRAAVPEPSLSPQRQRTCSTKPRRFGAGLPPLLVDAERLASAVSLGVHGRRKAGMGESFWQFRRYPRRRSVDRDRLAAIGEVAASLRARARMGSGAVGVVLARRLAGHAFRLAARVTKARPREPARRWRWRRCWCAAASASRCSAKATRRRARAPRCAASAHALLERRTSDGGAAAGRADRRATRSSSGSAISSRRSTEIESDAAPAVAHRR